MCLTPELAAEAIITVKFCWERFPAELSGETLIFLVEESHEVDTMFGCHGSYTRQLQSWRFLS